MSHSLVSNSWRSIATWTAVSAAVSAAGVIAFLGNERQYVLACREDSFVESLTALFYAVAGGLTIWAILTRDGAFYRSVLTALLGLLFLFVAVEEISWGQRIFDIPPPDWTGEQGTQWEINLHNLRIFNRETLLNHHTVLNLIALFCGVLVPVAYHVHSGARKLLRRMRFPVGPLGAVPFFVFGLAYGQTVAKMWPHWAHSEFKEFLFSVGFLLLAVGVRTGASIAGINDQGRAAQPRAAAPETGPGQ